jgi:hypothetical protein
MALQFLRQHPLVLLVTVGWRQGIAFRRQHEEVMGLPVFLFCVHQMKEVQQLTLIFPEVLC